MSSLFGLMIRFWLVGSALWAALGVAFFWDDFMCALGMGGNLNCGAGPPVTYEPYVFEVLIGVPLVGLVAGLFSIWAFGRGKRLH